MVSLAAAAADLDETDLAARIDRLRRQDLVVALPRGVSGRVHYQLVRHAFPFGVALDAGGLGIPWVGRDGKPKPPMAEADQRRYQETVSRYFSAAVACNEMKWYGMEPRDGVARDEPGLQMLAWCRKQGLPMRGHCVFWGIDKYDQGWKGMTEAEQARDFRRFVSLCFAHPAVCGLYQWGFWEGRHWRPDCALWRTDWSLKPNGQVWVDLMTREWTTAGEAEAAAGSVRFRGFPGLYTFRWKDGEVTMPAGTRGLPVEAGVRGTRLRLKPDQEHREPAVPDAADRP